MSRSTVVRVVAGVVAGAGLLWIVAVSGLGMSLLVPAALRWAAPEGWTVEVGNVGGAWHSRVHLRDLELRGPHTEARVEDLLVDFRLLALFSRTIELQEVVVVQPLVRTRLSSPASDTANASAAENEGAGLGGLLSGSPLGAWTLDLIDLDVRDAEAVLQREEGRYSISDGRLRASADLGPQRVSIHVDSLLARVTPPAPADSVSQGGVGSGWLVMAADLENGLLDVDTLSFESPRSLIAGSGELLLAAVPGLVDRVDFEAVAHPLDLRDLPVSLPELWIEDPLVWARVAARGAVDSMVVEARADGPGESSVEALGILRMPTENSAAHDRGEPDSHDEPGLELTMEIRGDLTPWPVGPFDGDVSAELEVRLDSLSLQAPAEVHATLIHRPTADTLSGLIARDVRVIVDLSRGRAPVDGVAGTRAAAVGEDHGRTAFGLAPDVPIEASAQIFTAAPGSDTWRELGELSAAGTPRDTEWHVDLALDSGSLAGRGTVDWAGEPNTLAVERLVLLDFDVSGLASSLPATDITGQLQGQLAGAALDDLTGNVTLRVDSSSFAATSIESATLRADLTPGTLEGELLADAAGRELSADLELALHDSVVSATLSRFRVTTAAESAAPPTAEVVERPASELDVRGSATGTWTLGEERRASFSLALDSAAVMGLVVSDGSVDGTLLGDSVMADVDLRVQDLLSAPAAVDASVRARGTTPAAMVGRIQVTAVRTGVTDSGTVDHAGADTLTLTVAAEEPGKFVVDGALVPAEGGRVHLDGRVRVSADSLAFDLLAAGGVETPTSLLRDATIDTLRVDASGVREADVWKAFRAELLVRNAAWRGVTADTMRVVMSADSAGLRVDTISVESEVLTLTGGGTLPQDGSQAGQLDLRASFQLEPLRNVIDAELPEIGENAAVATITGTTDSLTVSVRLEVASISYATVEVADAAADARAVVGPPFSRSFGVRTGAVDLELDAIALPDADVQNLTASLTGSPDSLRLEMSALVDETRTGELVAIIDPRPEARFARLERFDLQLDEDEWALTQPARISYADGVALRSFHIAAGEQAIIVDAGVTDAGALDASVAMDSTDVGTVSDLLGFPRLEGWLAGTVELRGTMEAPRGTAALRAGFHTEGRRPTMLDAEVASDGTRLAADLRLIDPTGGTLSVDGSTPLAALSRDTTEVASAAPVRAAADPASELDLQVEADAFDVSSAVAFVDSELLAALEGRIDASLEVGGTLQAPAFQGPLELTGGRARLPALGVTWESIRLHAHGAEDQLVIDSARVRAGPGYADFAGTATATAEGTAELDIGANLEDFQAIENEQYRAEVSGSLHVGGTVEQPLIEGDVQVQSLDVYIGESASAADLMAVELGEEDLEILRDRFGYVPSPGDEEVRLTDFLTADITVDLSRDSWLRKRGAPEMAVAFTGEVEVQLRPDAEPRLQGVVTTIADRGYIQQFGKRFQPREGTVTLDGPPDSARVDVAATYTVPSRGNPDAAEATIVLSVEGTRNNLALTLSSEPPMENADIVSYVATGRPAASNLALGDGDADQAGADPQDGIAETGAGIALGQIIGAVERAAQEGIGLDVIEIQREGIRSATLVAGKYVTPRLYIGFAQPVTHQQGDGLSLGNEGETEAEIEYEALDGVLLNIEGSDAALRIFLRGRLAY